jgi:hypothetical protein
MTVYSGVLTYSGAGSGYDSITGTISVNLTIGSEETDGYATVQYSGSGTSGGVPFSDSGSGTGSDDDGSSPTSYLGAGSAIEVIIDFNVGNEEQGSFTFGGTFNNTQSTISGTTEIINYDDGVTANFSTTLYAQPALPPIISFNSGSLRINALAGTATYTLTRGPVPLGDTGSSVDVSTMDGTAVAGRDFTAINEIAVFGPGQTTSAPITVPIFPDSADAAAGINPDFEVILSNPTNASIGLGTANTTIIEHNPASDFTGGGTSDVLWFNPTNHTVGDWLMNNGTPTWQVVGQGSSTVNIEGYGDFTGKGTSDVLWENPTNGLVGDWLMNNNVPTWQQIGQGSTTMNIAGVGDFYGTGTDDILWLNPTNNLVGEWQMNNNTPTWELIGQGSTTMNIVGIGDFTGHGKDDILWENPTNNLVGMWAMNGSTPSWSLIGQGSTTMQIVGVGDFTGNGTDDILWENPTNGTVGFWAMNNGQVASWNVIGTANTAYQVAGISDYYGNGTDDILWRNPATGDVGIWAMNNGQATWHDLGISSTSFNTVKA